MRRMAVVTTSIVIVSALAISGATAAAADPVIERGRFSGLTAMAAWFDDATGADLFVSVSDGRSSGSPCRRSACS